MNTEFYEKLLEKMYDGVYFVDKKRTISFWNESAERITGFSKKTMLGNSCYNNTLRHIDDNGTDLCLDGCPLAKTLQDGKVRELDAYLHHRNGYRIPISIRVSAIKNENGEIEGAVEIFSDNSKRIDLLKEIETLKKDVFIDPLTKIGNRKYGVMNITTRLQEMTSYNITFGVLIMDIDHFKKFNDTYGHNVGDEVLVMVASTIANLLRKMDIVARWGGEEFIVVVPNVDYNTLETIGERIRKFVEKSWLEINGENLNVTISVGGALSMNSDSVESLIDRADKQLYNSKHSGRNRVLIAK